MVSCCVYCDASQPGLLQFSVREGEPAEISSPFFCVRRWISDSRLAIDYGGVSMRLSVVMNREKTHGQLIFTGNSRTVAFKSIWKINTTSKGSRMLSHIGEGYNMVGGPMHFFMNRLAETVGLSYLKLLCSLSREFSVSAENAFVPRDCRFVWVGQFWRHIESGSVISVEGSV